MVVFYFTMPVFCLLGCFLLGFLGFLVFSLLSFGHDRSPRVIQLYYNEKLQFTV
jgi:hypothetical protein